jgi:hypothetical protein
VSAKLPKERICGSGVLGHVQLNGSVCSPDGEGHQGLSAHALVIGTLMLPAPELGEITSGVAALAIADGLAAAAAADPSSSRTPQLLGKPHVDGLRVWDAPPGAPPCGAAAEAAHAVTQLVLCGADLGVPSNRTLRAVVLSPREPARVFRIRGHILVHRDTDAAPVLSCSEATSSPGRRLLQAAKSSPHGDAARLLLSALTTALAGGGRKSADDSFSETLRRYWPEAGLQDRQGGPPVPVELMSPPFSRLIEVDVDPGGGDKKQGLSGSSKAGIIAAGVILAACVGAAAVWLLVAKRRRAAPVEGDSDDNLYVQLDKEGPLESGQSGDPSKVWALPGSLPSSFLSNWFSCGIVRRCDALTAIAQPPGACPPPLVHRRSRRQAALQRSGGASGAFVDMPASAGAPRARPPALERLVRSLVCACVAPKEDRDAQESAFASLTAAIQGAHGELREPLSPPARPAAPLALVEATQEQVAALLATSHTSPATRANSLHPDTPLTKRHSYTAPHPRVFLPSITPETAHARRLPNDLGGNSWVLRLAADPVARYRAVLLHEAPLLDAVAQQPSPHMHALALCRTHASPLFADDPFGLYWTAPLQPPMLFAYLARANCPVRFSLTKGKSICPVCCAFSFLFCPWPGERN